MNKPLSTIPSLPAINDPTEGGVRISITNQHGQCHRYRAQAVSLSMRKGVLQVIENEQGSYVWFDQCNLEIRDGVRNLLFHFKTGAASKLTGAELVILAELVPSGAQVKARHPISAHRDSAAPLPD